MNEEKLVKHILRERIYRSDAKVYLDLPFSANSGKLYSLMHREGYMTVIHNNFGNGVIVEVKGKFCVPCGGLGYTEDDLNDSITDCDKCSGSGFEAK